MRCGLMHCFFSTFDAKSYMADEMSSRKRQRTLAEFDIRRIRLSRQREQSFGETSDDPIVIGDETEEVRRVEVRCPMCNADITQLEVYLKEAHAERCLDRLSPPPAKRSRTPRNCRVPPPGGRSPSSRSRPLSRSRPPLPSIKVVPFHSLKVVVDGFSFARDDSITHYFLSHFHSDHYMGLCKSWDHGVVYGSTITVNLARNKFNLEPARLRALPLRERCWVTETLSVVLLDANHCPGAAVFLFQEWDGGQAVKQVLHTGDFRSNDKLIAQVLEVSPQLNEIYLDTTYLIPGFHFPTQESVLQVTAQFARELLAKGPRQLFRDTQRSILSYSGVRPSFLYKFLFLVGTYTIGKEKLAISIAQALKTKIFVPRGGPRNKIISQYIEYFPSDIVTHTLTESCVHLVPLKILRSRQSIQLYFSEYSDIYEDVVGFIPTGWTFTSRWARQPQFDDVQSRIDYCRDILATAKDSLDMQFILSQYKRCNRFQVFSVPYSEHSSFKDLINFGCRVPCGQILATVNLHSQEKLREMQQWFAAWKRMGARR